MIPAEFDYAVAETVDEAIRMLVENGEEAKLLAGGHSLLPLMKLRLAAPALLIDIRRIPGLHSLERTNGSWSIGAMVVHAELARETETGIVARAAGTIADPQVRNRGTIGGSLAHGDPAGDLPAIMLITEASVKLRGPTGERSLAASELFRDYLEFNRRSEDWAMVAVSAVVKAGDGVCEDVRIGLTNMGSVPLRASAVEEALRGQPLTAEAIAAAAEQAAEGTDPPSDLNASAEYKRHLARVLCRRALGEAAGLSS